MTSKERVLAAISLEQADRVPVDFWGTKEYVDVLAAHLDLKGYQALLDYFETDIRYVYGQGAVYEDGISLFEPCVRYNGPQLKKYSDGRFTDLWGAVRKYKKSSFGDVFREVVDTPLSKAETIQEVENYPGWPKSGWFDYTGIAEYCRKNKDCAIFFGGMPGMATVFIQCWYMRGLAKTLEDLVLNPSIIEAIIEQITFFQLDFHENVLNTASEWIDVIQIGDDYGTEKSLMMSPELFKKYFKKSLKRIVDLAHQYSMKVMLHSDGNVRKLIPEFIEIGVDILNPIQWGGIPEMDPIELKKEFGKYLSFHGGIDTQQFLPKANKADIKKYVRKMIENLGKGGGYILSPTHTLELDVPLNNVITLYSECSRQHT